MKVNTTNLAAIMVCALSTAQSQANLTWQGGNGNWFTSNWTNGVTSNLAWSGSVANIGNVGAAPNPITLNGWLAVELHTYNGGYLNPNGQGLTGSIHVEDSSRFDIVGNNPHTGGLTLAKGRLQLGYGGNYTPVGGNMVVNAGNLQLASQAASGMTIAGNLFVNGGSVDYQFNNQIGDTAFIYARGGTINMGAKSDTVGGLELSSGSVISNGKLTSASTYDVRKGTISAELAGSVGLTKSTADTVTLSGTHSYSGATAVNDTGKLVVNGNISTSILTTVASTATLAGTGTVGAATVNGTLAPGDDGIESLDFTSLTLGNASSSLFEINTAGNAADLVIVSAALFFDGALTVTNIGAALVNGDVFNLFDWGSASGSFNSVSLPTLTSGLTWDQSQLYTNGSIAVIPEPATALLGGLGMLALLRRRR